MYVYKKLTIYQEIKIYLKIRQKSSVEVSLSIRPDFASPLCETAAHFFIQ